MTATYDSLLNKALNWGKTAVSDSWLTTSDISILKDLQTRSPASLFEADHHRPLIAAFFGGTGVGKSSLLNRLAGQAIARTGVERPTSREVSLYLHESIQLKKLSDYFPLDRVHVSKHHNEEMRQVVWIDMPDFDSVELDNRTLVLEWLPHIDVLIYVVSPERYRDDKGWRLIQTYGCEHAWIFIINQWDRADPAQYDDFSRLLAAGGFDNPIILRTNCRDVVNQQSKDDFDRLQHNLQQMADQHILRQLELRTESIRLEHLHEALAKCLEKIGGENNSPGVAGEWTEIWETVAPELEKGLEWSGSSLAKNFVRLNVTRQIETNDQSSGDNIDNSATTNEMALSLWDSWSQNQLEDAFDQLIVESGNKGIPPQPLKHELDIFRKKAGKIVINSGQNGLRLALANPGNRFQHISLKVLNILSAVLPLAAISWTTYEVVIRYYKGEVENQPFLGSDFAIHSLLLIGLSWLLPFFAAQKIRPDTELAAIKGIRQGLNNGLVLVGQEVAEIIEKTDKKRINLLHEGQQLCLEIEHKSNRNLSQPEVSGLLARILPKKSGLKS